MGAGGGHREPAAASLVRVRVLVCGGKLEVEYLVALLRTAIGAGGGVAG